MSIISDAGDPSEPPEVLLEALTPLGFWVRVTRSYWHMIVTIKHPIMNGREEQARQTLEQPDEIRRSKVDPCVLLFYKFDRPKRWVCVVIKKLDGEGFIITAYPTDAIKEGVQIWRK